MFHKHVPYTCKHCIHAQEHHEEQLLEPGVTGEPQKLKLSLSAQVGPFHISSMLCDMEREDHQKEVKHPEALTGLILP